ncbi:hypothetical protein RhiirC2_779561 [Rhizophagus irregularis]|uniref:Uncharacterized protein n=1 Tax=Rhizophagus irregularis TaxID=588596 RepID=A0A2N1N9L4_9GLOM|nr:hypothetical protein RhiirC2_779561 [Rhizophagus irregularis]
MKFTTIVNSAIETGESFDFSTAIQQTTPSQESSITSHGNMTGMSNTSCNFTTFDVAAHILQVLNYLKFYYFSQNDVNFYLVICKIILQDSFNDHNHYDHEFFYQHPSYPTIRYHVSCKLLSYSLVENILNNEMCGINFDTELLSTNDVGNNEMITQTVSSMAGNQNYNDSDFSSNEHITHQDTNGLATRIFQ